MTRFFLYDAFLAHSIEDIAIVQEIAEKLQADGLNIWFDERKITEYDTRMKERIEEGLEHSRLLILCVSEHVVDAEWTRLESYTFRFRDPVNKDRRFIPLQLDHTSLRGSLAQFQSISWLPKNRARSYEKLTEACRGPVMKKPLIERLSAKQSFSLGHTGRIGSVAFSPDSKKVLSASQDKTVRCWDVDTGNCLHIMEDHEEEVISLAWSPDGVLAISGSDDCDVRLWEADTGNCIHLLQGHSDFIYSVAFSPDGSFILSGSADNTMRLWNTITGKCEQVMEGHTSDVYSVACSPNGTHALSASDDGTIRLWDVSNGNCLRVMNGHASSVTSIIWNPDGKHFLSGSKDNTIRLWDAKKGKCLRVLEGHQGMVASLAWSPDGKHFLSGSVDSTIRLWAVREGKCVHIFNGHTDTINSVAWSDNGLYLVSGSDDGTIRLWDAARRTLLRMLHGGHTDGITDVAWHMDAEYILSGSYDRTIRYWQLSTGKCLRVLEHTGQLRCIAWSPDGKYVLSGTNEINIRLWNVETGECSQIMKGHSDAVSNVAWSPDGLFVLSVSEDESIRCWEVGPGKCLCIMDEYVKGVNCITWSIDGLYALSGSYDKTIRLWDVHAGKCIRVMEGHTSGVSVVVWSPDNLFALSAANDNTIRLWEIDTGKCIRVMEGHTEFISSLVWSPDGAYALSGAIDGMIRLWHVNTGQCLSLLIGHTDRIVRIDWNKNDFMAYTAAANGIIKEWDLSKYFTEKQMQGNASQMQYTNAKVLLVGDSGVGKTGLSNCLALGVKDTGNNVSTDGAWATQWKLQHASNKAGVQREIWLWDFAGQVDYRLVHQLFMEETSAAVLVFNPQQENPFDGLGQWDRDLQKSSRKTFTRLLAAGRIDRGGLVVSDASMQKFMHEREFRFPLHVTSAKTGEGCETLRQAIEQAINWQNIPETTSPVLYHQLKQEILQLRNNGMVLIRLAELKQRIELALSGEYFTVKELLAVIRLLAGPGMIQQLDFGGFILLRPEVLSRYAAAVVRKVRKHPRELGCICEDDMLKGVLDYQDFERLPCEDEKIILRALHETLINRAWCLRQVCDGVAQLIFPSYFRRERPEKPHRPNVHVTYRFSGPIDDIYATLVVRLHHTETFESDQLWKDAADFKTQTGQGLGIKMLREMEGVARLEIYFNADVGENMRLVFARYVHNHLNQYGTQVERLRHYFCGNKKCDAFHQPFTDQAKIDKALAAGGKGKVFCSECGKPILLRDAMELKFESSDIKEKTQQEEEISQLKIDNESLELILVGHAFSITAEAGQIFRPTSNSDHGIDGEIEFKDDQGHATGKKLYVQLKSGDSYLKDRKHGVKMFQIKNPRWVDYWQQQPYPVLLVIRNSEGDIRWMEVSDFLKRNSTKGGKPLTQILFHGEPFDVMSIRRWRDKALNKK